MSSFFRAWYAFLGLGFMTFMLVAFVGQPPYAISSAIALPTKIFYRVGANARTIALSTADRRNTRAENQKLQTELDLLSRENRQLEIELERLQNVLNIRNEQSSDAVLTAPVSGLSTGNILKELSLGKGSLHGVIENMPVTAEKGLVGLVTETTARSASVRTIMDPQSRVGVSVKERGGQGIAIGMPGGLIRVINYTEDDTIRLGDTIETSSRGGFFPRGISLGTITNIPERDPNSLRIEFIVTPAVDVSTLMDVALLEPQ